MCRRRTATCSSSRPQRAQCDLPFAFILFCFLCRSLLFPLTAFGVFNLFPVASSSFRSSCTDDFEGFRHYSIIIKTVLHELAHMVHSEHDKHFHALNSQLNKVMSGGGGAAGPARRSAPTPLLHAFSRNTRNTARTGAAARWGEPCVIECRPFQRQRMDLTCSVVVFCGIHSGGGMGVPGFDFDWNDEPFHGDTGPDGRRLGGDRHAAPKDSDPRTLAGQERRQGDGDGKKNRTQRLATYPPHCFYSFASPRVPPPTKPKRQHGERNAPRARQ